MTREQLEQLQQRREELKYTIVDIAENTFKTTACISLIFRGKRNPSSNLLEKIVGFMGGAFKTTPDKITFPKPKTNNDAHERA